ncbi:MAG: hypothetical protein OXG04_22985 [Acidobacteria bacterium]|nr:hypothetical protein [Acidobacteriota bacterium]
MPDTAARFLALLRGLNVGGQNGYRQLTVRNHRTVLRLRELLDEP